MQKAKDAWIAASQKAAPRKEDKCKNLDCLACHRQARKDVKNSIRLPW
jgi:hypothetical protein